MHYQPYKCHIIYQLHWWCNN